MSPVKGLVIGLDVGTRTIGLARMHTVGRLATPWFTLSRQGVRRDVTRLQQAFKGLDETPAAVVVGLPLELDGTEGRSCKLARQVGKALAAASGLPVHYHDERFSTVEAERRLQEAGWSAREQRSVVDQAAAAVILEDWLATSLPSAKSDTNVPESPEA